LTNSEDGVTGDSDPFRHHPELRGEIVDPLESAYRTMDLALLDEKMVAAGAPATWRHSDGHREKSRRTTLEGRLEGDLWLFAYGSLMWDPAFRFNEVRTALLKGYGRSFCVRSTLGRGTPEKPGLMAGLDQGGDCHGLAFRIGREVIDEETRIIWRREMLLHAYAPEFVALETGEGGIEALAFVVDHSAKSYLPGLSLEETAHYMATGAGVFGSSLAYLENLAEQFATIGIEDAALFKLCDRAREIAA